MAAAEIGFMQTEKQCRLRLKMNDKGQHFIVDDRGYRVAKVRSIKTHQQSGCASVCEVEFLLHDDDAKLITGSMVSNEIYGNAYTTPDKPVQSRGSN